VTVLLEPRVPPTSTPWVPIGPSQPIGMPSPVVNGQWIKGVGGAAVWSKVTPTDVSGGIEWHGPFEVSSGNVGAGTYVNITVAHNLGRTPNMFFGWTSDSNWGMNITWLVSALDSTNVSVYFGNHGDIGGGSSGAALNVFLMFGFWVP
jgi:hypothetical protein